MPCHVHDTNNNGMQIKHDIDKNGFMAPLHGTPATASGPSVTSVAYQHVVCERERERDLEAACTGILDPIITILAAQTQQNSPPRSHPKGKYLYVYVHSRASHVRVCLHQSIDQQLTEQFCVGMASTFYCSRRKPIGWSYGYIVSLFWTLP